MVESVHGRLPGIKAHIICPRLYMLLGLPGASDGKESACNAGDPDSIPGSEKIPWRREWLPSPVPRFLSRIPCFDAEDTENLINKSRCRIRLKVNIGPDTWMY